MTPKGHLLRLRCGGSERERFYLQCPERLRESFSSRMTAMARSLVAAGKLVEAPLVLRKAAEQTTEKAFSAIEEHCRKVCAESPVPKTQPKTFRDVAELWMNGTLCRRYPDDVKCLGGKHLARVRHICGEIFPKLGHLPLGSITLEQCLAVKADLAPGREQGTRRHYALVIRRVMDLAIDPLGLIDHSPLPKRFVPSQGKPPSFSFLYPDEDRALLACQEIPFVYRLLYGLITRTGLRISEALALEGRNVDLKKGVLTVTKSKTGRPRIFVLEPSVVAALESFGVGDLGGTLIFAGIERAHIALRFRKHLRLAGITRIELFQRTDLQRPIRIHDLRATFVTLYLAAGRGERWVMDRTGHQKSEMLAVYARQARHAQELDLGEPLPLDGCLGLSPVASPGTHRPGPARTRVGQRVGQRRAIGGDLGQMGSTGGTRQAPPEPAQATISAEKRSPKRREMQGGPADFVGVGQNEHRATPSPDEDNDMSANVAESVETILARALDRASKAEQWETVTALSKELTERRRERAGSTVVEIDSARRKKP